MDKLVIDYDLTPENCEGKGYAWYQDTIIDPEEPDRDDSILLGYLQRGWKIGKPASRGLERFYGYGIYEKIEKEKT